MTLAYRILYAVHGKGTHHKLALDACNGLSGPDAAAWRAVFLSNAGKFVEGAKAPDDTFKDFTNHVLHPRDGYWGGAPKAASDWYAKTVAALIAEDWPLAAYNAGVLTHYVADPLMPFHTAQSEAENNIHRATEWSINRAYDALRAEALARAPVPVVELGLSETWLSDLVAAGATRSNADYERLIAHYDISRGVIDPPSGLDPVGRRIVGDLLVLAAATLARVLDRAVRESAITPPEIDLAPAAILGALALPRAWIVKRLADAADRRQVEAMYDELMATGMVAATLPADDRAVKQAHAAHLLAKAPAQAASPTSRLVPAAPLRPVDGLGAAAVPTPASSPPHALPLAPSDDAPTTAPVEHSEMARARLNPNDGVAASPSIGPKTADRLAVIGIATVADLLACDPAATARALGHSHIDGATVELWQHQARLVLAIPGLAGNHARLLTGAGYLTAQDVASADPPALCAAVLRFALSGAGQQVLRNNPAPDAARIASWIGAARAA